MKKLPLYVFPLVWLVVFLIPACKSNQDQYENSCTAIRSGEVKSRDPVLDLEAQILEGCLELKVTYSGGCRDHQFDLYWNGSWAESVPPVAYLQLAHKANNDPCRARKLDVLRFDLSELKYKGQKRVNLRIIYGEESLSLDYSY